MKKIFTLILLCLAACKKNTSDNQLPQSVEALKVQNRNCTCDPYIKKYSWKDETVYLLGYSGPTCNWIPAYFTADGYPLTMLGTYTVDDFFKDAHLIETVWSCQER